MGCTESKPEAAVVPTPAKSAPPQVPTASKPAGVAEAPKDIPTLKTEEQAPKSSHAGLSPGGAAESVPVALPPELDLTELSSKLSTDLLGRCTSLEGIVVNAPPTSSADAASWYNTAIWPEQTGSTDAPMTDDNILYSAVARPAEEVVICTIKGSGTTLSDGKVTVGDNAALVFDSSCSNVSLKNLIVFGGVIVCYGEGCSLTFTNCELQSCTVMCLAGACVTLKQTTVEYGSSLLPEEDNEGGEAVAEGEEDEDEEDCDEEEIFEPAQAVGLFVSGPGSKMYMQDGMVQGCTQGIAVQDNAQFFGSCSRTEEHPRVMIRDTKNAVEVCKGALFDFQDLHVQGADGSCVHVHSSARADLRSCIAGDAATGYALRSGAALSLFRCDINSTCIAGVALSGGATADLKECWVHDSNDGDGIYVHGSGSKVTATLCCINDNASHAVMAEHSGVAVLTKCFVGDMPTSDDEGEAQEREEPLCHETDGASIEQSEMVEAMAEDLGPPAWIHTHPEWEVDGIWAFQKK